MTQTGYVTPNNKIIMGGNPLVQEAKVENATNMYPGRLVSRGTNDDDIIVCDGSEAPIGWLGYEQAGVFMPDDLKTAYAVDAQAPVLSGAGNLIYMPSGLAAKTVATKRDLLASWGNGQVVPVVNIGGRTAVKIPFSKSTTEVQTVTLPAGSIVREVIPYCTTAVASSTIDIGTLSSDSGDADGFIDGASLATAGFVVPNQVDTTAANNTIGELLVESDIKTADATALYYSVPTGYLVPAGGKVLTYTTSDHTVAGFILVVLENFGIGVVGKCEKTVSAASAAADIQVRTLI